MGMLDSGHRFRTWVEPSHAKGKLFKRDLWRPRYENSVRDIQGCGKNGNYLPVCTVVLDWVLVFYEFQINLINPFLIKYKGKVRLAFFEALIMIPDILNGKTFDHIINFFV